jgi:hypothetical protein
MVLGSDSSCQGSESSIMFEETPMDDDDFDDFDFQNTEEGSINSSPEKYGFKTTDYNPVFKKASTFCDDT